MKQKGYRLTKQRSSIFDTLPDHPASAPEIYERLIAKDISVDRTTVYRSLDFFVHMGIVTKTLFAHHVAYEKVVDAGHHHHAVCEKCGHVEHVPVQESHMIRTVQDTTKFQITSHMLEFFGVCVNCQSS